MPDLTREAVLALPAGPGLDALVAEKVMGWPVVCRCPEHGITAFRAPGDWVFVGGRAGAPFPFRPSADIAAAWRVVEKICRADRGDGKSWTFEARMDDSLMGVYFAAFVAPDAGSEARYDSGGADGMAANVCRAALLAVLNLAR